MISSPKNSRKIRDIGYEQSGFHWENVDISILLHEQSTDIAMGVDASGNKDEGAGDQGIMFGYACRETDVLMPAPIQFSHLILKKMADARRRSKLITGLGPDSKSQVSLFIKMVNQFAPHQSLSPLNTMTI